MPDLAKQRLRSKFEAALLDASAGSTHKTYGVRKAAAIGAMRGTVVELGPGTGVNMRYYAPGTSVIGIEPNPTMHDRLRGQADEHGVDLEIRTLRGESLDVADSTADGVVGTLLLCGVDDPAAVVQEVLRVLKPGGTFFFLEHVAAPPDSFVRRVQGVVRRPHRWLFNGCIVDRDTESVLRAGGFSALDLEALDEGASGLHVRHRIVGTAVK